MAVKRNFVCVFVWCLFVPAAGEFGEAHELSLYFMLPFIGVSLALLQLNWFVIIPVEYTVSQKRCLQRHKCHYMLTI